MRSDWIFGSRNEGGGECCSSQHYEFNSSIYFFFLAKMVSLALKTCRRIQEMKFQPTLQTLSNPVYEHFFSRNESFITIMRGHIKRNWGIGNLVIRVMAIGYMEENGMQTDMWMGASEFLKLKNNLYIRLRLTS